jgi:RNA polymerase subunit RPABC4/transcription elongation factor Spt4
MRECAVCHTVSEDHIVECPQCGADLTTDSVRARALAQIMSSPRANAVFVVAPSHACPVCRATQGTFPKDGSVPIPVLPHEGCSCVTGCICRYEPLVVEVGP